MNPLLEAVNDCLAGIGEAPVSSVDDPSLDAAMAQQVISRESRNIQARGWWFNKEANWKITPDPQTGFISPPINAISVSNNANLRYQQFTIRSNRIYDVDNHTYDMRVAMGNSTSLCFDFIIYLEFNDLPPVAQWAVATRSKRMFAQDLEVDTSRWNFQTRDEQEAMTGLYREDGRNSKRNYLKDSPTINSLGLGSSSSSMLFPKSY